MTDQDSCCASQFVASIGVSNVVSAFQAPIMIAGGITDVESISYAGAGFQAGIVAGGIILGGLVDRTLL